MALFVGFFCGTLSMLSLYNLHWYKVTEEKGYLYYSINLILLISVFLQTSQTIVIHPFFTVLNANLLFIVIFLFSKEFLSLKASFKKLNMAINVAILFVVTCFAYSLFSGDFSIYEQPYSLLLSPLIIMSFYIYRKGFKPAIYYTIAWGVAFAFVGVQDLNSFTNVQFYPEIPFDYIGDLIQSIILSYAISVKTSLIIKEKEEQSKILIHQARLASMGQMLENISHQWRQPLNRIATFIINMQVHIKTKYSKDDYLEQALDQSQLQLEYMSNTINDFTNFNKQAKDREEFIVSAVLDDVYKIVCDTLEKNKIAYRVELINDFSMFAFPGELAQVLLNLVQNAQDALLKRDVNEAEITIIVDKNKICVQDNAGGVDPESEEQIFEPYFSTKRDGYSLGLGLYICRIILDKYFNAKIEVSRSGPNCSFDILFFL